MGHLVMRPRPVDRSLFLHYDVLACQSFFWQVAATVCSSFRLGIIADSPISVFAFNVLCSVWCDSALAVISLLSFSAALIPKSLLASCLVYCWMERPFLPLLIFRRRVDDVVF